MKLYSEQQNLQGWRTKIYFLDFSLIFGTTVCLFKGAPAEDFCALGLRKCYTHTVTGHSNLPLLRISAASSQNGQPLSVAHTGSRSSKPDLPFLYLSPNTRQTAWDDTESIVLLQCWCLPRQIWTCQMKSVTTTVLKKDPVLLFGSSSGVERKLSEAVQFWMCFSKNANIYPNWKCQIRKIYEPLCDSNAKESWKDTNAAMLSEREKWDINGVWVDRPYVQGCSFVEKWEIAPCKQSLQHLFILLLREGTPKVLDKLNATCHHSLKNCRPAHEDVLP